jgi:hypothetical protein
MTISRKAQLKAGKMQAEHQRDSFHFWIKALVEKNGHYPEIIQLWVIVD